MTMFQKRKDRALGTIHSTSQMAGEPSQSSYKNVLPMSWVSFKLSENALPNDIFYKPLG